ncbi:MAG: hypothetical protein OEM01_04290 [Desulfobulbaceae bacterium]|nr:hypothetical protein [Desulfobulbaceae bacterium]
MKKIVQITGGETGTFQDSDIDKYSLPWSKDSKWIVYEENDHLHRIKPDGTGYMQLTKNVSADTNSHASFADDTKIYYEIDYFNSDSLTIMTVDVTGTNPATLPNSITGITFDFYPLSSPDGAMIAYSDYNDLFVANADGSNPHKVSATNQITPGEYSWSPDSQRIAYTANDGEGTWIYTVKADDGTDNTPLTKPDPVPALYKPEHSFPRWSPDGNYITYHEAQGDGSQTHYRLKIVKPDGTGMATLDAAADNADWNDLSTFASWNPDSSWIAYRKQLQATGYYSIFIVNVSNNDIHQLTKDYKDGRPYWSPDGSMILFKDSNNSDESREDSGNDSSNVEDLLILHFTPGALSNFPWHMFLPAIQSNNK